MDQALYDRIQELQALSLFRKTADGQHDRIVNAPFLGGAISSAFERMARFDDPTVEVARLGLREVHFACFGFDAVEDGLDGIADMKRWNWEGAINLRRMAGGRC